VFRHPICILVVLSKTCVQNSYIGKRNAAVHRSFIASSIPSFPPIQTKLDVTHLRLMGSHSDGVVSSVESNKLRLEHDVAVDLEI
jgi:hypothetical protein